jgi:peptidoglycan/xylan/chitin deacetylase (PgdA/CDA1 family)
VYCGGSRRRLVALTFDDGPGVYTRLALKELRRAHVRATFFLVGKSIHSYPAWPRRERALAALGDHTETHPLLPRLPAAAMVRELADGQRDAHQASGASVRLFRPPYGATNAAITAAAKRLGMVEVLWSIDSGDSISGDFHAISARVRRAVRPGSIVLMHENRGQTIRALRSLLPYLRRRHLHPVSVPELLAVDPPSPARLRAGAAGCTRA